MSQYGPGWGPALAQLFGVDIDPETMTRLEFSGVAPQLVAGALQQRAQGDLGTRDLNTKQYIADQQFSGQQPLQLMKMYTDLAQHQASLANDTQKWQSTLVGGLADKNVLRQIEQAKLYNEQWKVGEEGKKARDVAKISAAGHLQAAKEAHQMSTPEEDMLTLTQKLSPMVDEKQRDKLLTQGKLLSMMKVIRNPERAGPMYQGLLMRAQQRYPNDPVAQARAMAEAITLPDLMPPAKPAPPPVSTRQAIANKGRDAGLYFGEPGGSGYLGDLIDKAAERNLEGGAW